MPDFNDRGTVGYVSLVTPRTADHTFLSWNDVISRKGFKGEVFGVLCFSRLVFPIDTYTK